MRSLKCLFCAAWLSFAVAACGGHDPAPRTIGADGIPAGDGRGPIHVVSGLGNHAPVANALVTVNARQLTTDQSGTIVPFGDTPAYYNDPIDVDVQGFLPRKTTVPQNRTITMWPVADQDEADALHTMVYQRGAPGFVVGGLQPSVPAIIGLIDATSSEATAWDAGARAFGDEFHISLQTSSDVDPYDKWMAVSFRTGGCAPSPTLGFCLDDPIYKTFAVASGKATDPETIRRVLAAYFLGPNPRPGFMNLAAPAHDLTPFEHHAIEMILQRPRVNWWPDTDR
jgi:hypothetical protein